MFRRKKMHRSKPLEPALIGTNLSSKQGIMRIKIEVQIHAKSQTFTTCIFYKLNRVKDIDSNSDTVPLSYNEMFLL